MENSFDNINKNIKKVIHNINHLLQKEKFTLKKDMLELYVVLLFDRELTNIFIKRTNMCTNENQESIYCMKEIKKYFSVLNKINCSNKERLCYLLSVYEYCEEIFSIYNSRQDYIKDNLVQFRNMLNGINYFNPNIQSRDGVSEKIKLYKEYFSKAKPQK